MTATWESSRHCWVVSLWSDAANSVTVHVVNRADPFTSVLDVDMVREGDVWSAVIAASDIGAADLYGFRVDGPVGDHGFDPSKFLLDPEATSVWFPPGHDRGRAKIRDIDTIGHAPMGVLRKIGPPPAMPPGPRHAVGDLVIYELHVRGATQQAPHVPAELRGTFAGLSHHVDYIASLGVTAVELMPIHQGDPQEGSSWGYMPLAWNALHHSYVAGDDAESEFCAMVQAFHDAGIEVILDVVYNHTTEEDQTGPCYHLRGIDDAAYYVLNTDGAYNDDAGCGNVVRAAHHASAALIMGSLRRYADMGVDGFRFDLGSLLGRDLDGNVQERSALIDEITTFAAMRGLRLITEPWDIAAYQLGDAFPGRTWAQWNGRFRDDVRSFVRAEEGFVYALSQRVAGSPDLFGDQAARSVNFVTAHDGFTLYDSVSYESKHNDANGNDNNDGTDDNRTWNCGWEGDDIDPTVAADVLAMRNQQMRNLLCALLLSKGVPMLLGGDEFANSQSGNNNAYNQDNETSWLDWERASAHADLTDFVRSLTALRSLGSDRAVVLFGTSGDADVSFTSRSLAWEWGDLYVMSNAWWEPLTFTVQSSGAWDVALHSCWEAVAIIEGNVVVPARTTVVLRRSDASV